MLEIKVSESERFELSSTSKGNQIKWYRNDLFIKADTMGYEGFAEALTSELFKYIDTDYSFIDYFLCKIIEDDKKYNGCCCKNYLSENEIFVSLYRLLQKADKNIDVTLKKLNGIELVDYVVNTVREITDVDIYDYLGFITKFDSLILNEDRHLNNINIIYDTGTGRYNLSPVFDNGLSLLSDTNDYELTRPINVLERKVKSKPFSTSFSKQVGYFDTELLKIDYSSFLKVLSVNSEVFDTKEKIRAREVLLHRLKSQEGKLWIRQ